MATGLTSEQYRKYFSGFKDSILLRGAHFFPPNIFPVGSGGFLKTAWFLRELTYSLSEGIHGGKRLHLASFFNEL